MIRPFFRWYDLWVGAYWDRECEMLYVCPVPMLGVAIDFRRIGGLLRPSNAECGYCGHQRMRHRYAGRCDVPGCNCLGSSPFLSPDKGPL